jgi:hypothetical protein
MSREDPQLTHKDRDMRKIIFLSVGILASGPAFAQLAGDTQNTGPQGTGNFVVGNPAGNGTDFVAGNPAGNGTDFVKGKKEQSGEMTRGQAR